MMLQDGYEHKRNKNIEVPIILLTAKGDVENRIKGLELGADDYMTNYLTKIISKNKKYH